MNFYGKQTSDINQRLSQLYTNSVPVTFKCEYACKVTNCSEVETALHKAFNDKRINQDREFFMLDASQPIAILQLLEKQQNIQDMTEQVQSKNETEIQEVDREANKKLNARRPNLNFIEMGIPLNSVIDFANKDIKAQARVISEKTVRYENQDYSLSALTQKLLDIDYPIGHTPYWSYNGKTLLAYYNETYLY